MKRRLTAFVAMIFVFTVSAFAANAYKTISVNYDINLSINGNNPILTDAAGNNVQPFTYNGTTYVPIRAVAENMGSYVGYEPSTKTAIVFQDDKEAIVLAHKIAECSHTFEFTVESIISTCNYYKNGTFSFSQSYTAIGNLANEADDKYSKVNDQFQKAYQNDNLYLSEVNISMNKLYSEAKSLERIVASSANYLNTKQVSYYEEILNELEDNFIMEPAYEYATNFIDTMW